MNVSFASNAKKELCRIKSESELCQKAELSALIKTNGQIHLMGENKTNLTITTENPAVARLIFTLFKKSFNIHTAIEAHKKSTFNKRNSFRIKISESTNILVKLGILNKSEGLYSIADKIDQSLIPNKESKRAYLRGVFLGGGSVNDPKKGYHLELNVHNRKFAQDLIKLMNHFELNGKIITRKSNFVIYLKESEQIVDFLNIIGAHKALLEFENVRALKGVRNNVNRIVNCETANLNKTINAAVRHARNIKKIDENIGLESLDKNLRALAELRLAHEEASLKELGEMMTPKLSKSGVNYRLNKIDKIAKEFDEGE